MTTTIKRTASSLLAAALLTLGAPAALAQSAPAAEAAPAEAKPKAQIDEKAQAVIDKYVEATGGADLYKSIKSLTSTGTINIPSQGLSGSQTMHFAEGPKMLLIQNLAGLGEFKQGIYDGTVWSMDPLSGAQLTPEEAAQDILDSADPRAPIMYADLFKTITYAGETEFEGKTAVAIELLDHDGDPATQYFDPDTGLMVGSKAVSDTPQGRLEVVSVMENYKAFDGMMIPTRSIQKLGFIEIVAETTDFSINKVDASVFEPPAAIKTLIGD
ncbi:MAG: hypothetical protein AAF356_03885 [Planctomycetota bacterium]